MTADANRLPKYLRAAAAVKAQVDDGTLRPGQAAPSGAALGRLTGYSTLTCRKALRVLITDGVLLPGTSRSARPRVAGPAPGPAERDLTAASRALSAGLAARRRANGLTQPQLARLLRLSVTTIGHAETGRLWQSRDFWEHADAVLGAGGDLLRLHDAFGEASAVSAARIRDPGMQAGNGQATGAGAPQAAAGEAEAGLCAAALTAGAAACPAAAARGTAAAAGDPACILIMWGNGTVTTVRPPQAAGAVTAGSEAAT